MRKTAILLTSTAAGLAFASPFVAYLVVGVSDSIALDGVFYSWFLALPGAVDALLAPDSEAASMALAVFVYFVQYLVLFAIIGASMPTARLLNNFVAGPQHRRSRLF